MSFSVLGMFLRAIGSGDVGKVERYKSMISGNETVRNDFLGELTTAPTEIISSIAEVGVEFDGKKIVIN